MLPLAAASTEGTGDTFISSLQAKSD